MSNLAQSNRPFILLVSGTGGHGEQLKRLRRLLRGVQVTVIAEAGLKWDFPDSVVRTRRVVDYHHSSFLSSAAAFLRAMAATLRVVMKTRPDLLISTGPALAVPVCLVCRILLIKVVHIESWSRISSISNTTRLIQKFRLADVIAYQYPDSVLQRSPRCEYWGHL